MGLVTLDLPTVGSPNSTEDPKVRQCLIDLRDLVNGSLDDANIASGANISGAKLADASVTAAKLAAGSASVYSARVFNSANIAVANNTTTALTFNSERHDVGDLHSTSANTGRLVAPATGVYHIYTNIFFAGGGNTASQRQVAIRLNGATNILASSHYGNPFGNLINVSGEYKLSAGDYVEVTCYQDSTVSLNALASNNTSPEFGMTYLNAGA